MEENKSNAFMDFLNDPSQIVKSTKFGIATAGLQFVALIFFAIIGASIGFRFENFRDIWNLDYWISVVVLLMEQLYAMNIGYELGRTMSLNSNKELKITQEQIATLIEGAYEKDTNEEIVRPLKKDSAYVEQALRNVMDEDKITLVKDRMDEIIAIFESKLDYFNSLTRRFYLLPKKIKVGNIKKKFHKKSTAIRYCEQQIKDGNKMLKNEKAILAVPDNNVSGFYRFRYADLVSDQENSTQGRVSRYYQKSEKKQKSKMFGKKALVNILMAMIGPAILFGVIGGDQALGMIVYSIFLLFVQLANGFKQGASNVVSIVLYNSANRLKAIQDVKNEIKSIKEKEKQQIIEAKKEVPIEEERLEEVKEEVKEKEETTILPPLPKNMDILLN